MLLSLVIQQVYETKLIPTKPFNFDGTFFKPDHFSTRHSKFQSGTLWQTLNWQDKKLGLKYINSGTADSPEITLQIFYAEKLTEQFIDSLIPELRYRYNLDLDLSEFYQMFVTHPALQLPIKQLRGMRPGHPNSLYEYLIVGVVLQNASVRRSVQMFENLIRNYGEVLHYDGQELDCLWSVGRLATVPEAELRALKIGYRAKSLLRIDEHFRTGKIDEYKLRNADVDQQKKELLAIYGVGPATVWYLLFDVFHRWEVFDHISPWEQKLYSQLFFGRELDNLADVSEILTFINQFGKYKHLAVHYMWENLWWRRKHGEVIDWLEKEIRS